MSKRSLNLSATIVLLVALLIIGAKVFIEPPHSKWIMLSGMGGKCLEVEGGKIEKGAPLIGSSCHGNFNQQFDITFRDGQIKVGDLCVDLAHGSKDNGTQVILWTCHEGSTQIWLYDNQLNSMINRNSKCMDLAGGEKAWNHVQPVVLWSCNELPNQKWFLSKKLSTDEILVPNSAKILPNSLQTIYPPDNIRASTNGFLFDVSRLKDYSLPKEQEKLRVLYTGTVVELENQQLLVPAKSVFQKNYVNF